MRKIYSLLLAVVLCVTGLSFVACHNKKDARTRYMIEAEYLPQSQTLVANMQVTVYNCSQESWERLPFFLYPNAYREGVTSPVSDLYAPVAYYRGENYGGIEIQEVTGATYSIEGEERNILALYLEEPLYPDEKITLNVCFTVTLAYINHRLGVGERTVNFAHFYPTLCAYLNGGFYEHSFATHGDAFVLPCADFSLRLTLPQEYILACAGSVERAQKEQAQAYHIEIENAREVAFLISKEFEVQRESVNGVQVEYYYFDGEPSEVLKYATKSLAYFSNAFCKYQAPRYVVVQTNLPYGGMEYSGMSVLSSDLRESEVAQAVVHETAHQWWYALVGSNQFLHAWQDEGLCELSSALYFNEGQEGAYQEAMHRSERAYRAYFSTSTQIEDRERVTMDRPLTQFLSDFEYRCISYDKSLVLFDRVRSVIGDKKFFTALKEYAKAYAGKIASPEDLVACFHKTEAKVEGLFASFREGLCVI